MAPTLYIKCRVQGREARVVSYMIVFVEYSLPELPCMYIIL